MSWANLKITCLLVVSTILVYVASLTLVNLTGDISTEYSWFLHLFLNVITYSTIILPGYLVYKYVVETHYIETSEVGTLSRLIRCCFGYNDVDEEYGDPLKKPALPLKVESSSTKTSDNFLLFLCAAGLQLFYLSWGVLQEKVMTQKYINSDGQETQFRDSQFLVFVNRILALFMSGIYILSTHQPAYRMPLYKYIYCSFSNIMSSWCQYEALKFVSFPTQVLAKASKIIPVMIMGKVVSGKKFPNYEYYTAAIMSAGMIFFMLEAPHRDKGDTVTTFSGVTLLILYIVLDSFTSNWQDALFKTYFMSSVQMMFGVNLFSCLFTSISLLQQNEFFSSIYFMCQFPKFTIDCLLLSICSAAGQLLIFFTISKFGPVTFAIIMTVRQFLAVLLSCLIYKHYISYLGVLGVVLVFGSVLLRHYCKRRRKLLNVLKV